jgi:hypothetical protein
MSSDITDFGAGAWLGALLGVTDPITGYFVALASDAPGVAADGDILADLEPAFDDYARQPYGTGPGLWALNGNVITNLVDVDFGVPAADWGPLTHYVLCDSLVSGQLYGYGLLANPQTVQAGFSVVMPAGGLVLTLASQDDSITV